MHKRCDILLMGELSPDGSSAERRKADTMLMKLFYVENSGDNGYMYEYDLFDTEAKAHEKLNYFESWLNDDKQGGALGMLASYR